MPTPGITRFARVGRTASLGVDRGQLPDLRARVFGQRVTQGFFSRLSLAEVIHHPEAMVGIDKGLG